MLIGIKEINYLGSLDVQSESPVVVETLTRFTITLLFSTFIICVTEN